MLRWRGTQKARAAPELDFTRGCQGSWTRSIGESEVHESMGKIPGRESAWGSGDQYPVFREDVWSTGQGVWRDRKGILDCYYVDGCKETLLVAIIINSSQNFSNWLSTLGTKPSSLPTKSYWILITTLSSLWKLQA